MLTIRLCRISLGLTLVSAFVLIGCNETKTPPAQPATPDILRALTNATAGGRPAGAPIETIFFSSIPWQATGRAARYFAWGWYPDVLVASPYAFQVQIRGDLFNSSFELRNSSGALVPLQPARANPARDCGPPTTPGGQPTSDIRCFLSPGDAAFVARPVMPKDVGSYSLQLETMCNGTPSYTRTQCTSTANSEPALLLTINPPTEPDPPQNGQTFEYTLSWTNSAGSALRKIKAIYVKEGLCRILSLNAGPEATSAFEERTVQWFVENCYSMTLKLFDHSPGGAVFGGGTYTPPTLATLVTQTAQPPSLASVPDFNGTTKFIVPPKLGIQVSLVAVDAMNRSRSQSVNLKIDPCTISTTHPQCPTRCQTTPKPSGCPQDPPKTCPNNADGHEVNYTFDVLCNTGGGTALYDQRSMSACTEDEAKNAVNAGLTPNCGVVKLTGPPQSPEEESASECLPPGTSKISKEFCLSCSAQNGPVEVSQEGSGCSISEAEDNARSQRPTQNCTVLYEGACK